ncbi:MAG: V-type ATPase 116kDa subunit family protein [Nitrososphaerota archaeon]|nr:hypothetical protein [Candidatus Bathyarchaeota archaeon]MCX8162156.1 hypothetical protein [Candidatus Bathyarchaeota archaeon]MDW8061561.1 V-type ATPase 116kDa subunit family protein [Nitrososphaerota archaeon]
MVPIRIYIHEDRLNSFLYELGKLRCFQFTDARGSIKDAQYVESGETLFRISSILTRLNSLLSALKVEVKERVDLPVAESLEHILDEVEKEVGHVEDEVIKLQSEIAELRRRGVGGDEIRVLEDKISRIAMEKGKELSSYLSMLRNLKAIEEAKRFMAKMMNVYIIEGWIPEERVKDLSTCVEKCEGYVEVVSGSREAPTIVKNPGFLKVFEKLVKTYGLPSSREIDPTVFFIVSFPLIFGMMFGDVGHGILLLLFGSLLHLLSRRMKYEPKGFISYILNAGSLMIICSPTTIGFGFLYGELFGSHEWFEMVTGLHKPLWFSPLKEPMLLFKYAILIGVVQISFGLILDLANKLLNRMFKEAIIGPIMWMWLYWSGVYLVLTYGWNVFRIVFNLNISGPFLILPFAVMVAIRTLFHGIDGIAESLEQFISSLSHTLSYVRILALNMIHGVFSRLFLPANPLMFIAFTFGTIFVILGFEQLLAFIHTLRLHWVEWFSKFYRGNGIEFKPFAIEF